jgi:cellulose synthase operon protein C
VRATPEAALDGLLFAVADGTVALRTRPGRESGSSALPGDPYARLFELPNLFAPLGLTVEPPLRRDRLRSWLASDPDLLSWLEPTGSGGFARITLPESAFRPLSEWVDYVIEGGEQVLAPWIRSATFDFESFTAMEDAVPGPRRTAEDGDEPATSSGRTRRTRPDSKSAAPRSTRGDPARPAPSVPQLQTQLAPSELEATLAREEQAFLELEAAADSPERRAGWVRLAELYSRLARHREGGLCWAHAIWESDNDEALNLARRWASVTGTRLDGLLALTNPTAEQTQAFVAHLTQIALSKDPAWTGRLPALAAWLDKFDESLDVRTLWLARVALSVFSGGDVLLLARARDRVLGRLTRGLSLERDVPRLLRVTGQANAGGGTERTGRVAHQMEAILKAFDNTNRKRSTLEAPVALTKAYVGFEFAWGFARLGQADRSRALRDASLAALPKGDPVHGFLTRAYSARIDQALEGLSPEAPLAAEVTAALNPLETYHRYQVDRLRQASTVLEPQERLDAISNFWRTKENPRGEELAALRGLRDTAELVKALERRALVAEDKQLGAEERARLLDALLNFLPQLPESSALPLLNRFVGLAEPLPTRQRVVVLEDALRIAGHFGRIPLVKQLVHSLGSLFAELGPEGVSEAGPALAAGVRSLRRVGLRDEASELLQRASGVLRGEDTRTLAARLALAAGFAYLGAMGPAQPIFDEAFARLGKEKDLMPERLRLTRAAARALGHAPTETALPGLLKLSAQLPWLTDNFNTNSHFCLSLVEFADALVLGHVGDDLTLNEVTRRFLEEDEYLVRRRVHRDAGG